MKKVIYYLPRILAICIVLFFGVFILEGFGEGFNWRDSVVNLVVTLIIAGITLVAWKRPQIGSWFFIVLGLFFSFFFHPLFWVGFTIGGITFVTGILFLFDSFTNKTFKSKVKLTLYIILAVILVIVLSYLAVFGRALTQSENHLGIALVLPEAIYRSEAVKIDDQKYLAKNIVSFVKTMERQGFTYIEQMGSGYFFEKDNKHYISTSRMYSAYFMVFTKPTISNQAPASAINEPNIGFKSVYQENTVPLSSEINTNYKSREESLFKE
ncbi:MAG: hypothetical protein PHR00_02600 [Patescibacteria group bacterium]|nr:hypothetical protein [Patescibacteria group bacterium]